MHTVSKRLLTSLVVGSAFVLAGLAQNSAIASTAASPANDASSGSASKIAVKESVSDSPKPIDPSSSPQNKTEKNPMKRVTGIGGVFIKAKDPAKLRAWYKTHLGIDVQTWGGASFHWVDATGAPTKGTTAWFVGDGSNFAPSESPFMVNYRVADLHGLVKALREEGCQVLDKIEQSDFGIFGWVMDPEGNKVELWQPPEGQ